MEIEDSYWQYLPPMILVEIFSFLSTADRFFASLVCRSWSYAFASPRLWRSFTFRFEGSSCLPCYDRKALRFAEQFGRHVKELRISCHRPSCSGCRRVEKNITTFFTILRAEAQVTHLIMPDVKFNRHWHREFSCDRVVETLEKFLKTQCRLQTVNFGKMDVHVKHGVFILQSIALNCSSTLRHLLLEDFLTLGEDVRSDEDYKRIMCNWRNLQSLSVNYSGLDSEILLRLIRNNAQTLNILKIKCRKGDICDHVISRGIWRQVVKLCPKINIYLTIERIPAFSDFKHLLPGEIPLKYLDFWSGYDLHSDDIWGLNDFLIYLKNNFKNLLETVNLEFEDNLEMVDESLVNLVTSCGSLKCLNLTASININTVDVICSVLIGKDTGLSVLHFNVSGLSTTESETLRGIEIKYMQFFLDRKVDFSCVADWIL